MEVVLVKVVVAVVVIEETTEVQAAVVSVVVLASSGWIRAPFVPNVTRWTDRPSAHMFRMEFSEI